MDVQIIEQKSTHSWVAPELTQVSPTQAQLRISGNGSFSIQGVEYKFSEPWDFDVSSDPNHRTDVVGYLVQNRNTDEVSVLVDTVVRDGISENYDFRDEWALLERLFWIKVPAGGSLDNSIAKVLIKSKLEE